MIAQHWNSPCGKLGGTRLNWSLSDVNHVSYIQIKVSSYREVVVFFRVLS